MSKNERLYDGPYLTPYRREIVEIWAESESLLSIPRQTPS